MSELIVILTVVGLLRLLFWIVDKFSIRGMENAVRDTDKAISQLKGLDLESILNGQRFKPNNKEGD